MSYASLSINELLSDITKNKYFLPAIQRKFVWGEEKICRLFNSIMRDYPIGTFLFWDLSAEKANQYTYYEFLKNYHQRDSKNELVRYKHQGEVRGVLDGQQRISSMYIALQGVYSTKIKHARVKDKNSYPERQLYLNLIDDENEYEFKFLAKKDAANSGEKFYYLVREIVFKDENADPDEIIDELISAHTDRATLLENNRKTIRKKINRLLKKFNDSQLISFFRIVDKDLDDILDIFVRVNSGGTILSKSDLLFSTLVAHWEDGRDKIEKLISDMNGEDGLFSFKTDFLMRTCLFLIDAPMSFKVHTFDAKNINKIKNDWDEIRLSLLTATTFLREFGFNKSRLSSNYATTPIAYYLLKGGIVNNKTKSELRSLVVHSLLKQVFSGQADSALSGLRDSFRRHPEEGEKGYQLKNKTFDFNEYQFTKLAGGKRLTIDVYDVKDFLEYKKGAFTFLILSILYPDLKIDQISFHQDHMHPHSKFNYSNLKNINLSEEDIIRWQSMRDQLPNLQLLTGSENVKKQATSLSEWINKNESNEALYREINYIKPEQSLELKEFESFFIHRKKMLEEKLHQLFGIEVESVLEDAPVS